MNKIEKKYCFKLCHCPFWQQISSQGISTNFFSLKNSGKKFCEHFFGKLIFLEKCSLTKFSQNINKFFSLFLKKNSCFKFIKFFSLYISLRSDQNFSPQKVFQSEFLFGSFGNDERSFSHRRKNEFLVD